MGIGVKRYFSDLFDTYSTLCGGGHMKRKSVGFLLLAYAHFVLLY
ncbi:hypothetical protein [Globicatella sanguinis]